ncbi:MAG: hypothetical protein QOD41_3687, partial [Cryptosporangiaceae bacterium]|nr:hypothetical protein [Cryptosporangiaceae bacterium]
MRTAALALGLAIALVPAAALAAPPVAPPASGIAPAAVRPALAGSALLTAVQTRSGQVEAAGETLSEQDAELSDLRRDLSDRTQELARLDQDLTAQQQVTDDWARTAFMSTGEFSPLPDLASSASPAANLARLKAGVAAARQVYLAGAAKEGPFAAGVAANHTKYEKAVADLVALQTANATQLATDSQAMDQRR